jgi:hypothetical protein
LIGFAPVFFGIAALVLIMWVFQYFWPDITDQLTQVLFVALMAYLLFSVSNNMFSSRKDLEGFIFVAPILALIAVSAYIAGFRLTLTGEALAVTTQILTGLTKALGIVTVLNFIFLLLNRLLVHNIQKFL